MWLGHDLGGTGGIAISVPHSLTWGVLTGVGGSVARQLVPTAGKVVLAVSQKLSWSRGPGPWFLSTWVFPYVGFVTAWWHCSKSEGPKGTRQNCVAFYDLASEVA